MKAKDLLIDKHIGEMAIELVRTRISQTPGFESLSEDRKQFLICIGAVFLLTDITSRVLHILTEKEQKDESNN